MTKKQLQRIYKKLYCHFGAQHWWPARSRLEVIIGTVLTQNTAWSNVEKAIENLRKNKMLSFQRLSACPTTQLARSIKPAGYFNVKAKRLKNVLEFIRCRYKGDLWNARSIDTVLLRQQLLGINGIGPETADSILLYALKKPRFVIDAYTKRIFSRLRYSTPDVSYEYMQELFMKHLPADEQLFNEYHALLVRLGKECCKKSNPRCQKCPLRNEHAAVVEHCVV